MGNKTFIVLCFSYQDLVIVHTSNCCCIFHWYLYCHIYLLITDGKFIMLNNSIGYFILTKLKIQLNYLIHICNVFMLLRIINFPNYCIKNLWISNILFLTHRNSLTRIHNTLNIKCEYNFNYFLYRWIRPARINY